MEWSSVQESGSLSVMLSTNTWWDWPNEENPKQEKAVATATVAGMKFTKCEAKFTKTEQINDCLIGGKLADDNHKFNFVNKLQICDYFSI